MRRFAAALSGKRNKSQSATPSLPPLDTSAHIVKKKSSRFDKPTNDDAPISPVPELIRPGLGTPSSSSSSDGSSSIRTPLDDAPDFAIDTAPRKWPSWIPGRRKTPLSKETPPDANRRTAAAPPTNVDESDDDDSDGYSSSSFVSVTAPVSRPVHAHVNDGIVAQNNLRAMLQSGLDGPPSSHPLLNSHGAAFPRSCNSSTSVSAAPSMQGMLHRNSLLRRLEARSLSATEQESILPFAKRSGSLHTRHAPRRMDEEAVSDRKRLVGHSRGLRRWLQRPTFEARVVEWKALGENVVCKQVSGTSLGVAELEFSDGLQALAGLHDVSPAGSPAAALGRSSPVPAFDLRVVGSQTSAPPTAFKPVVGRVPPKLAAPPVKQGRPPTRDEDDIPLGLVLKTRRDREERQKEALQEQQRRVKEEERRVKEEERQQKAYADEVLAARLRRERYRSGAQVKGNPFDVDARTQAPSRSSAHSSTSLRAPSDAPQRLTPLSSSFPSSSSLASVEPKPRPLSTSGSTRSRNTSASKPPASRVLPNSSSGGSLYALSLANNSRQSLADRRSLSESAPSARRHSDQQRTLPRSFKQTPPPPMPALPRTRSQPQVPMYPVAPVYMVPVVPVPAQFGGATTLRPPVMDPRMSWSTERLSMFLPPAPPQRNHIQ